MTATWILGTAFFVFIFFFLAYVMATRVDEPELGRKDRRKKAESFASDPVAKNGKYLVSRDYQVIFSPRVFVNYPFGIEVVFTKPGRTEASTWKPAEANGDPRSNVQRPVKESEYYGWPQSHIEDPELAVMGGHVEFESETVEPTVRVEVKPAKDSFRAVQAVQERVLKQDEDTVFSLWLNPLTPQADSLVIDVAHVTDPDATTEAASSKSVKSELAAIRLTVPVTPFPIALR